jgi:competence protein ComEC
MVSTMLYYLIIILIVNAFKSNNFKYIILLLITIFIHHNINYLNPYYKVIFLDVGQGDSILIVYPFNKGNILIDAPYIENKDIGKNIIVPYLKSIGINRINYLINTHGDNDHVGEFKYIINNFNVDNVIINCGSYNELELDLISELDKKKIPYYSCIKELNINNNKLYFLNTKEYDNENDNSNVIYTKINNYKFMFMGDAGIEKEKDILDKYNINDIDVLKVGHHGSKTSSGKEFINEVNPKYSIISVGKNNRYGHPNKEALDNLSDSKIYRTDQDGSIMFKIKNNKLKIETCAP